MLQASTSKVTYVVPTHITLLIGKNQLLQSQHGFKTLITSLMVGITLVITLRHWYKSVMIGTMEKHRPGKLSGRGRQKAETSPYY
ncbi:hypothetical protein XELAEV_18044141mg [Xenopus laevis]|uniref:Uncharacterized protein n=1 Tax=Xenopus laevis TaxID=8355 RepID=A0A974H3F6_XENLA|nr:hypothetical protein XELAEV_18044141mg [Xenopus laevis]